MVALKVNFLEYRDPGLTGSPPHFNQYYFIYIPTVIYTVTFSTPNKKKHKKKPTHTGNAIIFVSEGRGWITVRFPVGVIWKYLLYVNASDGKE